MTEYRTPVSAAPLSPSGIQMASAMNDARERAIRLLTDGYAYDVLTIEEFEWRLGQLSHADTPAAMDALVADLATQARNLTDAGSGPVAMALTEGRILGIMSETRREGPWRVPQMLRVLAVMSDVKVDLRYAVIPPACTIDIWAFMANVSFLVPPAMIVDFDVTPIMASARNDALGEGAGYLLPNVRIRGSACMAEVRVRVRHRGR